ncbi:hypothetical protein [Candidatus Nitrosotenuis aquarius]|uniref:hypothetical protein n=1 Tax=Candidatus Nitrosotenuis aquarius TaxID=1846278 RepID=UPI000C1E74F4|nr:hypothetical protein [Candidatus Nitrosotenuis aquarius]
MYKLFAILVFAMVLSLVQTANAEEIPNWIKSKIKLWAFDKVNDQSLIDSLVELSRRDFIQFEKLKPVQTTYNLPKYGETAFVKISGRTGDFGQTSPVTLIVTGPDGIRAEYTIPVLQSGAYSTSIPLHHYSPAGTYEVSVYHAGKELMPYYFHVQKNSIIPSWLKLSAKWWSEGKISDSDFLHGIQYLIDKKIIALEVVNSSQIDLGLDVTIQGQKAVRRGTAQNLEIHVENFEGNVEGATVFVRVEDYGENILEEFKGETDSNGDYSISYELSKDFTDIETFLVYVDVTDGIASKTKVFTFQVYCLCGESNCKCRN